MTVTVVLEFLKEAKTIPNFLLWSMVLTMVFLTLIGYLTHTLKMRNQNDYHE
jgi:hypothetical protein